MRELRGASVFWLISLVCFAGLAVASFVYGKPLAGLMLVLVLLANLAVGVSQPLERRKQGASHGHRST